MFIQTVKQRSLGLLLFYNSHLILFYNSTNIDCLLCDAWDISQNKGNICLHGPHLLLRDTDNLTSNYNNQLQ